MKAFKLRKKGFIFLSAVLFLLLFIVIVIPLINWAVNEFSWTSRSFMSLQALNLADAGAEMAAWEIIYNNAQFPGWPGINPKTLDITSFTNNSGEAIGDISISVQNTSPGHYLVVSNGRIPYAASQTVRKSIKVSVFPHALFNNGIFGKNSVTMSGNSIIDSYDSGAGPYSSLLAKNNGDVGTNHTLTMSGNSSIKGDVFVGPGGSISGGASRINGEIFHSANEVELPPASLPSYFTGLTNKGSLNLSGSNTFTMLSGNYIYQSISLSGSSSLIIENSSNIYIVQGFSISGQATVLTNFGVALYLGGNGNFSGKGIVNSSANPANLQIYGLDTSASLNFSGQSDFYGTIYAPNSDIRSSGNSGSFGAIVGKTVNISGNGGYHYDESLSTNGATSGYDIAYWQED